MVLSSSEQASRWDKSPDWRHVWDFMERCVVRVNVATLKSVAFGISPTFTKRLDLTSGSSLGFRLRLHNRRDPKPVAIADPGPKKKTCVPQRLCGRTKYLSFGKDKGQGKGKAKGKGKGRYLVRPSHLSLEDRRRRLKELKAKTECRGCGREGHWATDRECAMSSSSSSTENQTRTARMATRQQVTNHANQAGVCFVLNEYSDDLDTSAYMVGQNVPLPTEATEQIPLTPTASAAVDTKNTATFNERRH